MQKAANNFMETVESSRYLSKKKHAVTIPPLILLDLATPGLDSLMIHVSILTVPNFLNRGIHWSAKSSLAASVPRQETSTPQD